MATDSVRAGAESVLGDRKHRAAIVALAAVLALDGADRTALGALAPALKSEFGVGNTAIGLLAGSFAIVGALAIFPIGILTDRHARITILVVCIGHLVPGDGRRRGGDVVRGPLRRAWSASVCRAWPAVLRVTSLVGDLFPVDVHGRVLGWVKSGELVGAGAGFLVAGVVVALTSWRGVFAVLALMGLAVGAAVGGRAGAAPGRRERPSGTRRPRHRRGPRTWPSSSRSRASNPRRT